MRARLSVKEAALFLEECMAADKEKRQEKALEKELKRAGKQEQQLRRLAQKSGEPAWKKELEGKVPPKVYEGLRAAFARGFRVVFDKGTGVIERSYDKEGVREQHAIQDFTFQVKADRGSLKKLRASAGRRNLANLAVTAAEGVGLGAFGIGLPDIVVFVGMLLRGIYQISLHYGFDYDSEEERYLILKLMETALARGEAWDQGNEAVNRILTGRGEKLAAGDMERQIKRTADQFAVDMLLLKFVQGLPLVGILGGAGNPWFYQKVMKYAELKYRERYLLLKSGIGSFH